MERPWAFGSRRHWLEKRLAAMTGSLCSEITLTHLDVGSRFRFWENRDDRVGWDHAFFFVQVIRVGISTPYAWLWDLGYPTTVIQVGISECPSLGWFALSPFCITVYPIATTGLRVPSAAASLRRAMVRRTTRMPLPYVFGHVL